MPTVQFENPETGALIELTDPELGELVIDEETGAIHDVPWSALAVSNVDALEEFDVHEYQVVLRGKLKKGRCS